MFVGIRKVRFRYDVATWGVTHGISFRWKVSHKNVTSKSHKEERVLIQVCV